MFFFTNRKVHIKLNRKNLLNFIHQPNFLLSFLSFCIKNYLPYRKVGSHRHHHSLPSLIIPLLKSDLNEGSLPSYISAGETPNGLFPSPINEWGDKGDVEGRVGGGRERTNDALVSSIHKWMDAGERGRKSNGNSSDDLIKFLHYGGCTRGGPKT